MKRIVCPSTQRIIDGGTVVPAGTPHYETEEVADRLIAEKLAKEAPEPAAASAPEEGGSGAEPAADGGMADPSGD